MIVKLNLVGFKSFLSRSLTLNGLTVLTGLNSSGKSSVVQALLMMERASNNEDNILLDGYGSEEEIKNTYYNKDIILAAYDTLDNKFEVRINDKIINKNYSQEKDIHFNFPEVTYLSANRFGPKSFVTIFNNNFNRNKLGSNGENIYQFIEAFENEVLDQTLIHPNAEGETVNYNIRGWLNAITPGIKFNYKINKESDTSYGIFNGHRAMNVGFGLSYSLSVISSLLISTLNPKNSLLIIENPEAHLHPKGQTEIAKLISLCANLGVQIIIETHSDHLFDGIRISAKEIKNFAEKVQIHWFELNEKQNTEVTSPILNNNGKLDKWPRGLFDQFEINSSKLI